jgi:hypothetical protein
MLKRLEKAIIKKGMFSPNEDLKEIDTLNLKYSNSPFNDYSHHILGIYSSHTC